MKDKNKFSKNIRFFICVFSILSYPRVYRRKLIEGGFFPVRIKFVILKIFV